MSFPENRVKKEKSYEPRTDAKGKAFRSVFAASCRYDVPEAAGNIRRNLLGRVFRPASVTVECALALPLWFFAVVTLISFMQAVKIQNVKNLELSNRARQIAMYSGVIETEGSGVWIDLPQIYTYQYPGALGRIAPLRIALRARVYPWIGYGGSDAGEEEGADLPEEHATVYLTDTASVYHTHADCTHLDLSIMRTNLSDVRNLRNEYGNRYRPCSSFPANYDGPVYVTAKGDYYYPSTDYHSLTRHVRMVSKSECSDLRICERCAARDAA